jgi:outer membrane immunogenic protein
MIVGLVGMAAAGVVSHAQADSPDWTGCSAGVNVGYGWASISGVDTGLGTAIGSATARGSAFGGQLGCDRRASDDWILGVQLSADKSYLSGDHFYIDGSGPSDRVKYDVKSLFTVSGRVGHVFRANTLAYLRAGGAWARTRHDDSDPAPTIGVPYTGSREITRRGWLAGFGVERKIASNLSAYAEYDYMDFGRRGVTIAYSDGAVANYSFKQDVHFFGVGVNYRF